MQTNIDALIVFHVNGNLLSGVQGFSIRRLEPLEVSPDHVVGFAGAEALGELTLMVGNQFPARLAGFVLSAPDFHPDAVDGAIVWSPNGAKDQGVRLTRFEFLLGCGGVGNEREYYE